VRLCGDVGCDIGLTCAHRARRWRRVCPVVVTVEVVGGRRWPTKLGIKRVTMGRHTLDPFLPSLTRINVPINLMRASVAPFRRATSGIQPELRHGTVREYPAHFQLET
jgi:hypothetical protein